jgi:hypothetical protein
MPLISDAAKEDLKRRNPCDQIAGKWVRLRRSGGKLVGPCPICSPNRASKGAARFEVDGEGWVCAVCGDGGDVIKLVQKVEGKDFLAAVEWLGGAQEPDPAVSARQARERAELVAKREADSAKFREREREWLFELWQGAEPILGTAAHHYLKLRGLDLPDGGKLRAAKTMPYYHGQEPDPRRPGKTRPRIIHSGPALLAAIVDNAGRFAGLHVTYVDLGRPNGKAEVIDPDTGEFLPAKKVRGSKRSGHIHLAGRHDHASHIYVGEGIETVLSVRQALLAAGRNIGHVLFWAAVDLGNLGGRAAETVKHPSLTVTDARGHVRAVRVPGPVPDLAEPGIAIPDRISQITLLGDGDSERFLTECALRRAAARWRRPGRVIRIAWAPEGCDFNDLIRDTPPADLPSAQDDDEGKHGPDCGAQKAEAGVNTRAVAGVGQTRSGQVVAATGAAGSCHAAPASDRACEVVA